MLWVVAFFFFEGGWVLRVRDWGFGVGVEGCGVEGLRVNGLGSRKRGYRIL